MDYEKILSERGKNLKPSGIRKFFDVVVDIKDAISLGVGEPDFITPWNVRNAAITSLKKGFTQYTSNSGLLELREQISLFLEERYGLKYQAKGNLIVTVGGSEAIDISLRALLNFGDEVLVPEPSYVSYAPCVELCGGCAVPLVCTAENGFKLLPAHIEAAITPKTKAIILPYPNNPTGAIMEEEFLIPVAEICKKHNLIVLSDEIYAELTYGQKHTSIATLPGMRERTILLSGFSKAFAMTGWRIGFIAAPAEIISVALKIHQYAIMCAPTMSQYAALEALKSGFSDGFSAVSEMREEYDMRRRFVLSELSKMGLSCFEPKGAFYAFPDVSKTGMDGEEFANALLKAKKVAVVPGSAFGESCKNHVRMSYAASIKKLTEALSRINEFINEI